MNGSYWTSEEVALLREAVEDGATTTELMEYLPNRPITAIWSKMCRIRLKGHPGAQPDIAKRTELMRLIEAGYTSLSDIARRWGVCESAVATLAQRMERDLLLVRYNVSPGNRGVRYRLAMDLDCIDVGSRS